MFGYTDEYPNGDSSLFVYEAQRTTTAFCSCLRMRRRALG